MSSCFVSTIQVWHTVLTGDQTSEVQKIGKLQIRMKEEGIFLGCIHAIYGSHLQLLLMVVK